MSHDTEELAVSFDDIEGTLSQPILEDRIQQITENSLVYREAFRSYDATDINSDVVQLPVPNDDMGSPKVVGEGAEFPRDQESYTKQTLEFEKFGFEIPITWEAQEDSRVNLVQDQVDRQAREMREDMNERAFNAIDDVIGGSPVGNTDPDGVLDFNDILEGREDLLTKSYDPDLLIADVSGVHDLLGSNNFLEASEMQGELRRSGQVGRIAGMDVVEDDSGLTFGGLGEGNPGALMVDTDYFGYEGERTPVTTEEYGEDRSQTEVFRIFARYGWLVSDDDAGVVIEG